MKTAFIYFLFILAPSALFAGEWELGLQLSANDWVPDDIKRTAKVASVSSFPPAIISELSETGSSSTPIFARFTGESGRFSFYGAYARTKMGSSYQSPNPDLLYLPVKVSPLYDRRDWTTRADYFFTGDLIGVGLGLGLRGLDSSVTSGGLAYYGFGEQREVFATAGPELSVLLRGEVEPDAHRFSMRLTYFSLTGEYHYDSFDAGFVYLVADPSVAYRATEVRTSAPGIIARREGVQIDFGFQKNISSVLRLHYGLEYTQSGSSVDNYLVDTFLLTNAPGFDAAGYSLSGALVDVVLIAPLYKRQFKDNFMRLYLSFSVVF